MNKITAAGSMLTLICIVLIFNESSSMALAGWYGTFIFGMLSFSLWLAALVGYCRDMDSGKRAILSCRIFAVVDIVTALVLGIVIIANDTGFLAGLATLVYLFYILPVFAVLLIADLFIWSVKAGRKYLSVKIKAVLCGICLITAGIVYIFLWSYVIGK